MYYSITLLAFLMTAGINMNESQAVSSVVNHETIKEKKPVQKRKKNIVEINGLRGKHTVQVGQQLRYSTSVHGSVGYSASAYSSNSEALPLVESFIEYDDEERAEMSGGDSATKYFIFDAKKAGTYEIYAEHYFRGDLEDDFTIVITVEE
ncbi:MAG: hypothetical protein P8P74_18530 [Crocinitomicaceae bacterium]|nr:hypothetical protein [Crocinitomicaceae bacterium]